MLKVRILKGFDRIFGSIAVRLAPRPRFQPLPDAEPRRILLIRPGGIGDAVLLIPVIKALKERYPGSDITVLAEKRNWKIFSFCGAIRRVLRYDVPKELLSALRAGYDLVIDTEQWHRLSAVISRLTLAPVLIGYGTNERKRLFTHAIPYSHDVYEAESFFGLLQPLGITRRPDYGTPFLDIPDIVKVNVGEMLAVLAGREYVALFPGASIPERRWGAGKFHDLSIRLQEKGIITVVVGGTGDRETGDRIISGTAGLNLAGKTSLPETAAVLARSLLVVTGDSGILHIAVGLGVPTVSIFGPGIEKKWAPRGIQHVVLNRNLSCSPCTRFGYTPPCPINARCLAEIDVSEAERAVMDLINKKHAGKISACAQIP